MKKILFCGLIFSGVMSMATENQTAIQPLSSLGAQDCCITSNSFCEYPDICEDQEGNIWVVYTEWKEQKEQIIAKQIQPDNSIDSLVVSAESGLEFRPRITLDSRGMLWVVWAAKRQNNWDIYARTLIKGSMGPELRVTMHPEVDIRPFICPDLSGGIWIFWESKRKGSFKIFAIRYDGTSFSSPILISSSEGMHLRPAAVSDKSGAIVVCWDRQRADRYQVLCRIFEGNQWGTELEISSPYGFNLAPSMAVDSKNTVTIAWYSNIHPSGYLEEIPWIYLRQLRGGKLREIYCLAEAGDWHKSGEDQGFEFPQLIFDRRDRLWIFGRPSQGFFVQCIDKGLKSTLYRFEPEGWGGRGQLVKPILNKQGKILSIRRDLRYIFLNQFFPDSVELTMADSLQPINADMMLSERLRQRYAPSTLQMELPDNYQLILGSIHQHSALSDGMGTYDQGFTRSLYCFNQDFAAISDHDWFVGNAILPSEWDWMQIIDREFNQQEKITFPAYEWTTPRVPIGFGHKNIYYPNWGAPIFRFNLDIKQSRILFDSLRQYQGIAIPHHVGWTGVDWENHDEEIQPVMEIVSTHGAFEYMGNEPIPHRGGIPGNFIQDGLAKGLKFGLIGGSDGHGLKWHHGISRQESEWETGLMIAIVREKSSEGLFEAIRKRRVYATTGAVIEIDFRMNQHWMGESMVLAHDPEILINVIGTNRLYYVILLKDNQPIVYLGKDRLEGRGVRKTYIDENLEPGVHWYYLRVIQEDGQMAWTSPIWVERQELQKIK